MRVPHEARCHRHYPGTGRRARRRERPDAGGVPLDHAPRPGASDARLAELGRLGCKRIRTLGQLVVASTDRRGADITDAGEVLRLLDRVLDVIEETPGVPVTAAPTGDAEVVCPWCRDEVDADGTRITACPRCATRHHADCFAENGGCTVLGCGGGKTTARAPVR